MVIKTNDFNTDETVAKVKGMMKKSVLNILNIGKELALAKSKASKETYFKIYDELPFGEVVGNKFIAISEDKYIEQYADILPLSYNTIYDLLLSKKITDKTGVVASVFWKEISKYSEMMKDKPTPPVVLSGFGFDTPLFQKDKDALDAYDNELDAFFKGKYIFNKIQLLNKDDILNPSSTNKQIANLFKVIKFVAKSSGALQDFVIKDLGSFTPTKKVPVSPIKSSKSETKVDDKAPAETTSIKGATVPSKSGDTKADLPLVEDAAPVETSTKTETPSFTPVATTLVNTVSVVTVMVDADTITNETLKSELLNLQLDVDIMVSKLINKSLEVKVYDVPVANVGVKLPKAA